MLCVRTKGWLEELLLHKRSARSVRAEIKHKQHMQRKSRGLTLRALLAIDHVRPSRSVPPVKLSR